MKRRKINTRYLSERVPSEVGSMTMRAEDFATTIRDFANEYLDGALDVEIRGESHGNVKASTSLVAYVIRMMLEIVEEDEFLHLTIDLGDNLTMTVSFDKMPELSNLAKLVNTFRMAGFRAVRDGNTFSFSLKITDSAILRVYALSPDEFRQDMREIFFM